MRVPDVFEFNHIESKEYNPTLNIQLIFNAWSQVPFFYDLTTDSVNGEDKTNMKIYEGDN